MEKDGSVDEIFSEIGCFIDDAHELGLLTSFQEFSSILSLIKHSQRLRFNFGDSGFLLATIMPINRTLHLDFHSNKYESAPIDFDLIWKSVYYWRWPYISTDSPFKSIKSLHLTAVHNLTSEVVSSMLSKCWYLKSLIIKECHGLHSFRINTRSCFSKLMIFNYLQLKSLHIKSDGIDKFRFCGLLLSFTSKSFGYIHSFNLADAMLDFRGGPGYDHFTYEHSDSLISAIERSRILTLCRWTFEAMIRWHPRPTWLIRPPAFEFPRLNELQWIDNEVDEHSIDVLMVFLKKCPLLGKLYINIDPTSYSRPRTRKYGDQVSDCKRLVYLEVVQLEGVMKEYDKKLLANRLLDVVSKKTKIIAKSHENRVWKLEEVSFSLLLEELMKHYMFVEVNEEDIGKLCSKHAHADL